MAEKKKTKLNFWKTTAIVFMILFVAYAATVIYIGIKTSQEIKNSPDFQQYLEAERLQPDTGTLEDNNENTSEASTFTSTFTFDGIYGNNLVSKDFSLLSPEDFYREFRLDGDIAVIQNFFPNEEVLTSTPDGGYSLIFSYHDELPIFFETDFLSQEKTTYLNRDVILGTETWFGHPFGRAYYFEDSGLNITIQPADASGLQAAESLLQDLIWE